MTGAGVPRVTIGFPVYNGAVPYAGTTLLEQALAALLAQDMADLELVISDNASTDATETICQRHAARDPRIRYHRQPRNLGAIANFEWVRSQARGEYFLWASHDDYWEPSFLSEGIAALERNPRAGVAQSIVRVVDARSSAASIFDLGFDRPMPRTMDRIRVALDPDRSRHVQNLVYGLYRRSALATLPSLTSMSFWGQDRVWVLFLLAHHEVAQIDRPLFWKIDQRHGVADNVQTLDPASAPRTEWANLVRHCRELIRTPWIIPDLTLSERLAMTALVSSFLPRKAMRSVRRRLGA